jgi:hypothetical protein
MGRDRLRQVLLDWVDALPDDALVYEMDYRMRSERRYDAAEALRFRRLMVEVVHDRLEVITGGLAELRVDA